MPRKNELEELHEELQDQIDDLKVQGIDSEDL